MPIVGFDFDKIQVERNAPIEGKIKLKNNVSIKSVEKESTPVGDILKFKFEFNTTYEPKIGEMILGGAVIYKDTITKLSEILNNWKKTKKIPEEIMINLVNAILVKCNIKALSLSQEINLPPHLNLPRVTPQTDVKQFVK